MRGSWAAVCSSPLRLLIGGCLLCSCAGARPPSRETGSPETPPSPGERPRVVVSLGRALRPKPAELAVLQQRWAAATSAGKPIRVTIDARTTLGFGCGCAHFVHHQGSGEAEGVDGFFYPTVAPGVPPIAAWFVSGTFRLRGYFTGRNVTWERWHEEAFQRHEEPAEMQDNEPHPEFLVEAWCYDFSDAAADELSRETSKRMRDAGVPECVQPMQVAPATEP